MLRRTCLLFLSAGLFANAAAQDQPAVQDDAVAKRAAEFLQTVVAEMRVSGEQGDEKTLRPRSSPILRYNDPARVYPAAGVWRLGEAGRPPLLVSVEYWLRAETDEPRIMFEFVSFTDQKLELKADDQTRAFGSVIGKALRPLSAGQGLIPVLIALQ